MKRTIAVVAALCIVASVGLGYVVGRSAGGDTGDSISSRLSTAATPAMEPSSRTVPDGVAATAPATPAVSLDQGTPTAAGTPETGTPETGTPAAVTPITPQPATPEPASPVATPPAVAMPALATPQSSPIVAPPSGRGTPAVTLVQASIPASPVVSPSRRPMSPTPGPTTRPGVGGDGIPVSFETPSPGATP